MKAVSFSGELRKSGRNAGSFSRRVRNSYLSSLRDVWGGGFGDVRESDYRKVKEGAMRGSRPASARVNWKVRREGGDVVAVEPNREFEHVFEGGKDPFMEALEYAAKQLREGDGDGS